MTVSAHSGRNNYVGNGSQLAFSYTFKIFTKNDIEVLVDGVTKTVDTDYTVSGLGVAGGGTVTFTVAPANGKAVTLLRKQTLEQQSDYQANEDFPAERIEKDLDKLIMDVQMLQERLARAVLFAKKSTLANKTCDDFVASKFLQVKADLSGLQMATGVSVGTLSLPVGISDGGTGSTTPSGARDALLSDEDARTNTVKVVATQKSTTTVTPAVGIGVGEKFQAESADEAPSDFGQIEFVASDVGAGTEDTYFQILLRIAGAVLAVSYRFVATTAFRAIFSHANSADRTYTLPNNSGTIALTTDIPASGFPTGGIMPFGGVSAPTGFLLCDASLFDMDSQGNLADVIKDFYGRDTGSTFTADAGTDVITSTAHGLSDTNRVVVSTTGTLPGGLSVNTIYFVRDVTTNTFKLALTSGGAAIDITSAGTGTHRWHNQVKVPDGRGRTFVGFDSGQTEFDAMGKTGGAKTHTSTIAEMAPHTHAHGSDPVAGGAAGSGLMGLGASLTTQATGGGAAHNNLQPYIVGNHIIKT